MTAQSDGEPIHVIPRDDCMEHSETFRCSCKPVWVNEKEMDMGEEVIPIYVHNRMRDRLN